MQRKIKQNYEDKLVEKAIILQLTTGRMFTPSEEKAFSNIINRDINKIIKDEDAISRLKKSIKE